MKITESSIKGCFIIQPKLFRDERGLFFESFNQQDFENATGVKTSFVQDNQSQSHKGVLRGFHFQKGDKSQAKLVRVLQGAVQDVVVDLRPDSVTYGKHFSIILSKENNTQLFIPRGFAHGFLSLEDDTILCYKCDNFYDRESETGIIYNDDNLSVNWKELNVDYVLSKKDLDLPKLKNLVL